MSKVAAEDGRGIFLSVGSVVIITYRCSYVPVNLRAAVYVSESLGPHLDRPLVYKIQGRGGLINKRVDNAAGCVGSNKGKELKAPMWLHKDLHLDKKVKLRNLNIVRLKVDFIRWMYPVSSNCDLLARHEGMNPKLEDSVRFLMYNYELNRCNMCILMYDFYIYIYVRYVHIMHVFYVS